MLKRPLTFQPRETQAGTNGPVQTGPLAWWKLDETEGRTASDAAGSNFFGQLKGQPHWAPSGGARGGALEFDGAYNWVECVDAETLDLRDSLSVAVWFKGRGTARAPQTLMAKGDVWRLQRVGGSGKLEFALKGPLTTGAKRSVAPSLLSKQAVNDDQWHQAVGVYDGKRVTLYLDGVEQGSVTAAGPLVLHSVPVTLGDEGVTRGRPFNGWLDEARVYSRGLSAGDVAALYREGAQ